jgi:hypothetical protein
MPETEQEAMTKLCEELGIDAGDLDPLVDELKSAEARDINQEGLDAQIDYALDYVGKEELRLRLTQMKDKKEEPKKKQQVMLFEKWKKEADEEMSELWGINWAEACGDEEPLKSGYNSGQSPREFAVWWGDKYDLDPGR